MKTDSLIIMVKKFTFILIIFILFLITSGAYADEYSLNSSDGQTKAVFDSKYGGAITKIYDYANFGNQNLIFDVHAGAMFQNAFWLDPKHTTVPLGCDNANDKWWSNPTQAGFRANGYVGNPIGVFGVTATPDPKEFVRFEDNNKTIHFKSRFIRWDFCMGEAIASLQNNWDTNFYVEQWASFSHQYSHTLVMKTRISYEGDTVQHDNSDTDTVHNGHPVTKQWPIIFGLNLTRLTYIKNGLTVIESIADHHFDPDGNWAALLSSTKDAGIGMVLDGKVVARQGGKFGGGLDSGDQGRGVEYWGILYPGPWLDLAQFGQLVDVTPDGWGGYIYSPGGYFEWTAYYPIGTLSTIEQVSGGIASNFLNGDINKDGKVDVFDYNILVSNFGNTGTVGFHVADISPNGKIDIFDYNILVSNFGATQ